MITIKQFKPTSHKIKAVVYGASGSGKTSFAGTAENAVFASAEGGLLSIASKAPNYVEIKSLQDLKDFYVYLKTQQHGFETVIIDSITEINDIIKADIEKKTGKAMQLQDWGTLSKEIRNIFRSFRDLPMHCLFIAQEVVDEKDENGTASKIVPSLNGKASTEIAYFMDIVGYVYIAKDGSHRVITNSSPRLLTKDRSGMIGNDTPADFSVWVERVAGIEVGEENVTATFDGGDQAEIKAQPQKPQTATFFDTVKMRVETLKTEEQLNHALESVDTMIKLDDMQKAEIKQLITEKITTLNFNKEPEDMSVEAESEPEPVEVTKKTVKKAK